MPSIICPCVECAHRAKKTNYCTADKIILAERYLHTLHEGTQHVWVCKYYKDNGLYNQFQQFLRTIVGDPQEEEN